MSKLTPKQDAFVKAYLLNGGNATQASIDAGYSEKTAKEIGSENLTKPNIASAIKEHQKDAKNSFIWSKEKKLLLLEKIAECATKTDPEKGMINMQSAIAAMKEHNLMQGDNAPTETNNTHTIKSFSDMYGDS
jgi:phage terminase small subunit